MRLFYPDTESFNHSADSAGDEEEMLIEVHGSDKTRNELDQLACWQLVDSWTEPGTNSCVLAQSAVPGPRSIGTVYSRKEKNTISDVMNLLEQQWRWFSDQGWTFNHSLVHDLATG